MPRKNTGDPELRDAAQRSFVVAQPVAGWIERKVQRGIGNDLLQQLIGGDEHSIRRSVEADQPLGVAGKIHHPPGGTEAFQQIAIVRRPRPWRVASGGSQVREELGHRVQVGPHDTPQWQEGAHGALVPIQMGLILRDLEEVGRTDEEGRPWKAMGQTIMIGMAVAQDHHVHVVRKVTQSAETPDEILPGARMRGSHVNQAQPIASQEIDVRGVDPKRVMDRDANNPVRFKYGLHASFLCRGAQATKCISDRLESGGFEDAALGIVWIDTCVGYDPGPVNLGVVRLQGERALVIDAGLDEGRAGRLVRRLADEGLTPYGVILTHHHADHMGGARRLLAAGAEFVAAAPVEAGLIRHPQLQPLCFAGGAAPPPPLAVKFLMPPPVPVAVELSAGPWEAPGATCAQPLAVVELPGHTPGQLGLRVGDVLFCGDAVFPADTWRKYGLAYFADIDQALATLDALDHLAPELTTIIPGHGRSTSTVAEAVRLNREGILSLIAAVKSLLAGGDGGASLTGMSLEALIEGMCDHLGITPVDIPEFYLDRATVQAVLTHLCRTGQAQAELCGARLLWRPTGSESGSE